MHAPEVSTPSLRSERITTLPQTGQEVDAWMWQVVNGGTVPSDRRADDVQTLHSHAVALRAVGGNGQADAPLDARMQAAATAYARLLGWEVAVHE
ncbi:MAG: hypothetical protein PHX93_02605 [Candidatus Peribacteraceae bacterium]|jgi:hypothetical protein|nr:hypothetical protein [Candidatus Peribacteraceae bacterium]